MGEQTSETSTERKADTAVPPDDSRKPGRVRDIKKHSWKYIGGKTLREFGNDNCADLAASLTYYAVLSLFPALLALVSLLGLFGQAEKTASGMLDILQSVAPGSSAEAVRGPVEELVNSPAAGLALIGGVLGALWSASGYVGAFGRAMNRIYEVEEGRGFVRLRGTMLALTVGAVVIVAIISAMLVLSGPVAEAVGSTIGLGGATVLVWDLAKWPVALILIIVLIALLYYFTPNVKQPKFRWISMGSIIAIVVLAVATVGFGFYVGNFGHYNKTYGALGGVVILLLWLWIVNMSLLFGAEFDAETERGRELQAGIGAEEMIQLPPRATVGSEKKRKAKEKDLQHARELRHGAGRTGHGARQD
ncbi:YihY/virulence factor BrkB family protein [Sinomonas notoginsengisoli]|uniref:YihY/virulence factor BrkB family protein n=1 Tax=Sinomonas notoginsengisoli TaxID=1457311 RepID=UPI001F3D32D1|nr:YihY/virulence factor BrkB family protein [Sinomonas notoginsengisoli]